MTWQSKLEHRFVERIPRALESGVLYISMEYATAAHNCACGCGEEVMTPFTPTDWKMTFDGDSVSLWPSVGNWQLACRSHYIIEDNRVIQAGAWTQRQIAAEQRRDKVAKARYYGTVQATASARAGLMDAPRSHVINQDAATNVMDGSKEMPPKRKGFWARIFGASGD